jgi:hypothetical protein
LRVFVVGKPPQDSESSSAAVARAARRTASSRGRKAGCPRRAASSGYGSVCLSLDNTVAPCATGNANFVIYNQLGAPPTPECGDRQYVYPTMTTGSLEVSRKVYVPDTDSFARWLTSVKNTGAAPATVTLVTYNNLGSDSATAIVTTSSGDSVADLTDRWVTTFQNYSGTTSPDPRLGHVLQGPGAPVPLAGINFADLDDNPYWGYTATLAAGETARFLTFAVGQPSKAAAAAKAQELVGLPAAALQCLTPTEISTIKNFDVEALEPAALALVPLAQGVLKAGDTVEVQPSWQNTTGMPTTDMTGTATASNGGTLVDDSASYGVIAAGATGSCTADTDCYSLTVDAARPANHWDISMTETLSEPASHEWLLHVGDSFADVPRTSGYFRFVETVLHKGVTGGCTATTYCPGNSTTRAQVSIFALVGKEGAAYSPVACGTMPMFADVPVTSPYCKWVEELARRGVVSGCGGGNYCPTNAVTRGQMATFMLKTLDPTLTPPPAGRRCSATCRHRVRTASGWRSWRVAVS